MRKLYLILSVLVITTMIISCSSNSVSIKVTDVEVYGDIDDEYSEDYFQIKDGKYTFSFKDDKIMIELPITLIKDLSGKKVKEFGVFSIGIADEQGKPLTNSDEKPIELKLDNKEEINNLLSLNVGSSKIMTFSGLLDEKSDIKDKIHSFILAIELNLKDNDNLSSNKSTDWDSVLDDYEKFVDKYIKLFKKAQNGDTSAITEYAECLEKAQSLQEKLENAKSNLTSKQVSRLTKIINKLSSAAASAF